MGNLSCDVDQPLIELQEEVLRLCDSALLPMYKSRIENIYGSICESISDPADDKTKDLCAYGVAIPTSMESFVLREIRNDSESLPGRCLWMRGCKLGPSAASEAKQQNAESSSKLKSNVPNKKGNQRNKSSFASSLTSSVITGAAAASSKKTIRREKLTSGTRRLAVQILPSGNVHSQCIPTEGSIKLWVYRSELLSSGDGIDLYDPVGIPIDMMLSAGPMPSLPQLKRAIEKELHVPFQNQRVFKLFSTESTWKDLDLISEKRRKGAENLFTVPYSLKEGDSICVINRDVSSLSTTFGSSCSPIVQTTVYKVDRPIDEERRNNSVTGAERTKKKKRNQQEIGLRLAGNFEFSDEEDNVE